MQVVKGGWSREPEADRVGATGGPSHGFTKWMSRLLSRQVDWTSALLVYSFITEFMGRK